MPRAYAVAGLVLGTAVALGTAPAGVASAAGPTLPTHGHLTFSSDFDDPDTCAAEGFSFHVVETATLDFTVTFDSTGDPRLIIAHHHQHDVFTANGKTLVENDSWTDFFQPDGSSVTVGDHTHVQGQNGVVLHDSGRIVEAADGTIEFVAGKHPQFFGATFCQDLLP
jgi:hypothetical protein